MRKINNFNSILDLLREVFPLKVEILDLTDLLLAVVVPYFPSVLCNRVSSDIVFDVYPNDDKVIINFYKL